jgi:dienelactone hydrolase
MRLLTPLLLAVFWVAGCLSESAVYLAPEQSRIVQAAASVDDQRSTRNWLRDAHRQLNDLLPRKRGAALLTEDLTDTNGQPIDVFAHYELDPTRLHMILHNYSGLKHTAQGAGEEEGIDAPAAPWVGFEDVWIRMPDGAELSGRLGLARAGGKVRNADCIVVLPGFFGDNTVKRTRALSEFLHAAGLHVLALEMRGHGQTERTQPDVAYTFGVRETDDLMHVADWLQAMPHVRRTGLVGFCWSANIVLLAAWYENRPDDDRTITPTIADHLSAMPDRERYAAGILSFSPIVRWERLVDELQNEFAYLDNPVYATVQNTNRARMERKGYPNPSGRLRDLIACEYARIGVDLPDGVMEGHRFLRLLPYADSEVAPKLCHARVPVLIVHGVNDPLAPAQDVVDLVAEVSNPQVAAIMLPGGGHVGFANYAANYYYSLIASFFDPEAGAAGIASADRVAVRVNAEGAAADN